MDSTNKHSQTSPQLKKNSLAKKIDALLNPSQRELFMSLDTPGKIQDFLDRLPMNFSQTYHPPLSVLRRNTAQCIEGATLAAALFGYHGREPLLLDFQTIAQDEDHVVAPFKECGYWGAVSHTNHAVLRYRDPIYASVRELAMSYVHEYFMTDDGRKSLRAFSRKPFSLRRYPLEEWFGTRAQLWQIAEDLDNAPHERILPPHLRKHEHNVLRNVSSIECIAFDSHAVWKRSQKRKRRG